MKYYIKIDNVEYNASVLEITTVYRNENVQTNLAGGLLIDRIGTGKVNITAQLDMLTVEKMAELRKSRYAITCKVTVDRGDYRTNYNMRILNFTEPSPIYFYGDKSQGIRYGSVTLKMEEI